MKNGQNERKKRCSAAKDPIWRLQRNARRHYNVEKTMLEKKDGHYVYIRTV